MTRHLFAFDPDIIDVPSVGRPAGQKLTRGARACAVCRVLEEFAADWGPEQCPGPPPAVGRDAELPGTPPPEP